ncbi:MAG: peptide chain release factor 2 [Candidatus Kuenenbacteria bacterium]
MQEIIKAAKNLFQKIKETKTLLNLDVKKTKIKALEIEMSEPDFWSDQKKAALISKEASDLKEEVEVWQELEKEIQGILSVAEESEKEGDSSLKQEIEGKVEELQKQFEKMEFSLLMSGVYDSYNAIMAIHAGAGGTDAQDWAEMLLRMYVRYAEANKFKINIIDKSSGSEAGIKSVVFELKGRYAYGYLKSEAGVHRLVRISPFDAEKMRHTSFALVEVLPELEELGEVEVKDDDLIVGTFKSSGHGGQSVNTTDSAVRIRHNPTGITVTCQNERSQHQNKETAMKVLKSKLHQYYLTELEEEKQKLRGEFSEAAWGNQIRSYVLHPYKLVKDHRTNFETQEVEKVLDGELEEFIEAYLKNFTSSRVRRSGV